MRKALLTFAIVCVIAIAGSAQAQQPNIICYFNEGLTDASADCPPVGTMHGTVIDTIYVVANNFNMWMAAVEFKINYPTQLMWLGDDATTDMVIGNTATGISLAWPIPLNAFESAVMVRGVVAWMCDGCAGPNQDVALDVVANPNLGHLRALRWPDNVEFTAVGMRSLICAQVPVQETTWGQIKALYN